MSEIKIPGTCYLVGGAVRDELLGIQPDERDWVVVGGDAQAMLDAGFIQVGKSYPVFLHPITHEEYALARTERKIGPGHGGFAFQNDSSITLTDDLYRRDLTINAMARSPTGELIDPYGGQADLTTQQFRHVSDAFVEDPLRCFRVARFASKLPEFTISRATVELIYSMREHLHELSPERVWHEWVKALASAAPHRFYEVVKETGTADTWFPELRLDTLAIAHKGRRIPRQGAFALIGWHHSEHAVASFFERLRAPNKPKTLALQIARFGRQFEAFDDLTDETAMDTLTGVDALHGGSSFAHFLKALTWVTEIDVDRFHHFRRELRKVKIPGVSSPQLGETLRRSRLIVLSELRRTHKL